MFRFVVAFVALCAVDPMMAVSAQRFPWAPEATCKLNPARPDGLHPSAYAALQSMAIAHRITQGINHWRERRNVHDTDVTVNGKAYTAAADISVRCLSEPQIKSLLTVLGNLGFAAWYRKNGVDDWTGPPHIHAVWAGCSLKPVLRWQVESWLEGGNGLGTNRRYQFWQSSPEMKEKVRARYNSAN
jgi:hypothetical protein